MTAFPRPPPGAPAARPAGRSARGLLGIGRELPGGGGARAAGRGSARARGVGVGWGGRAAAARAGGLPGAAWPAPARGPAWRLTARGRAPGSRGRVTEAAAGRGSRGAEEEVPPPARQDVTNRKRVLAGAARAARSAAAGNGRRRKLLERPPESRGSWPSPQQRGTADPQPPLGHGTGADLLLYIWSQDSYILHTISKSSCYNLYPTMFSEP